MGLQKHMTLKRTKLLKQPNNFGMFKFIVSVMCSLFFICIVRIVSFFSELYDITFMCTGSCSIDYWK